MGTPTIQVLSDAVIDKIAAGEVVERPASVIKELVENAIDAKAKSIRVQVQDGGRVAMAVIDDGIGMARSDAALSVQRHATSKIRNENDLIGIQTLGFRGEALASIAAVSRFRLRTCANGDGAGTEVKIDGGEAVPITDTACAQGTRIDVDDLFYNVPARRKFLKARQTEFSHMLDHCLRQALPRPGLKLQILHDGKMVREFLPVDSMQARAEQVFRQIPLQNANFERGSLRCEAWLGPAEAARSGHKQLYFYVHDRAIEDYRLARAVALAFGELLPQGQFPLGVVRLWLDPQDVDVNVHPQKTEVRFARGFEVYDTITKALARSLDMTPWQMHSGSHFWTHALARDAVPANHLAEAAATYGIAQELQRQTNATSVGRESNTPRVLAQTHELYWICETKDGICVVDQHAAHEQLLYAQLAQQHEEQNIERQSLLFPERLSVTESELQAFHNTSDLFETLGFDVRPIADTELAIHALPALLKRASPAQLIRDVFSALRDARGHAPSAERKQALLAQLACRSALRRGDEVTLMEAQAMIEKLKDAFFASSPCPHPKIVVVNWPVEHLEQQLNS